MDVTAIGAGSQPTTQLDDSTPADEQAMADAINSVALMIAMNSGSLVQNALQDMKKAIDDAAEDSQT